MKNHFDDKRKLIFRILVDSIIVGIVAGLFSVLYRFIISKMDIYRGYLYADSNIKSILIL